MIDSDLAALYGVATKALNQAVRRNARRFPPDLAFRLAAGEREELVTKCDHLRRLKFSPVMPLVFTEHGALMVASVLKSPRAIEVGLYVVRAFVRMREILGSQRQIARRLDELERKVGTHDRAIVQLLGAIRELAAPPAEQKRRRIGF